MSAPAQRFERSVSAILATLALLVAGVVQAQQTTYQFEESDGTVWFTDHKPRGANFKKFRFVGYYGRPPATASCRGVTPSVMDTRAAAYSNVIERMAERYGVSALLVQAIISVESCFDRLARSVAGAQGLMQLMPSTARSLGVRDAYDPVQNINGGIRYFSDLQRRYQNNNHLALAAYNAGPAAVDRYNGIPPYRETRNYVQKVLKRYRQYSGAE
ncbi:MAG: lytic transglycosylase domain-containing protein [Gammaproteobacteria bacterium]|nr:lytic transglycosylase domain-containing protein [Gammaproteobacteria bacterium]